MGSVTKPTDGGGSINLPTIKLDMTLAELYKQASSSPEKLGFVFCGVNSGLDLNPDFPRNTKFLYQDSPFNTVPRHDLSKDNAGLQRSLAIKYLSLIPQRDAFISGAGCPVILFNLGQSPEQVEHDRHEAEATISVLDPSQRPELVFCAGPSNIPVEEKGIDKLAYKVVLDGLEKYKLTHDLETHWFLNSKAGLALSGLPTPRVQIVEVEGFSGPAEECCDVCRTVNAEQDIDFIPARKCSGPRGQWLDAQANRVIDAIADRKVSFVLKNQQTFGGAGTWVITTEEQKEALLDDMKREDGPLRKLLAQITVENHHLSPGSLVISDIVKDPIGDYGLTFLVKESGEAEFLAASEQMIDGNNAWLGSTINYDNQERLHDKFKDVIERTAKWVASHGYFGPVGVDVLETATPGETATHSGEVTAFHIVDLNVRTSGSLSLPLLRGHFVGRGLNCASSFSITVKATRREFMEKWKQDFEAGRMFIVSWYEDESVEESVADVVIGAEGEAELEELMGRVRESSEEVTF
ncbi:hypothetical protein B0H66DRAFT_546203 [Apodospora peruviana]|uniref:ATP-grasp domain-containing protein n=1 Tax=Apodospora peruviana TaxID=516989 RepID=A0AAE0IU95_9PEZI|nr:hypothetical protein B0H66DRAFT_546203 [Apodospora peruviana]